MHVYISKESIHKTQPTKQLFKDLGSVTDKQNLELDHDSQESPSNRTEGLLT